MFMHDKKAPRSVRGGFWAIRTPCEMMYVSVKASGRISSTGELVGIESLPTTAGVGFQNYMAIYEGEGVDPTRYSYAELVVFCNWPDSSHQNAPSQIEPLQNYSRYAIIDRHQNLFDQYNMTPGAFAPGAKVWFDRANCCNDADPSRWDGLQPQPSRRFVPKESEHAKTNETSSCGSCNQHKPEQDTAPKTRCRYADPGKAMTPCRGRKIVCRNPVVAGIVRAEIACRPPDLNQDFAYNLRSCTLYHAD